MHKGFLCAWAASLCVVAIVSFKSASASSAMLQALRTWPPGNIIITPPAPGGNCQATKIQYTIIKDDRLIPVTILTTSTKVTFDLSPEAERRPGKAIEPGTLPDVEIANGWAYLNGKYTSVGAHSVSASAESSKLIIDADYTVNGTKLTRVLHVDNGQGNDRVWYTTGPAGARETPVPIHKFATARADRSGFDVVDIANDADAQQLRATVQEHAEQCNVPGPEDPQ